MTIRWGVAGPGAISTQFGNAIQLVDTGQIVAVASRSRERAEDYGDRFDVANRYDSYSALAEDADVDAVYIGTPHSRHETDAITYLNAGKHVLCEKPMALSVPQVERMIAAARDNGVFLMEAMWSRFLPAYRILGDLLSEERIGQPLLVEADFGFRMPISPSERHFDPAQGGGALLDLGIYPLQLSALALGHPDRVIADGYLGETQVDDYVMATLHHPGDRFGLVKASTRIPLACTARIAGTDGSIEIPAFMHCPDHLTVRKGREVERIDAAWVGDGLQFEIAEANRCIADGLAESSVWPLQESLAIARTMDDIRGQLGVRYPGE
jgi:predicted dehydrogenase